MTAQDYPPVMFQGQPWYMSDPDMAKSGGTVDVNGNGVGGCVCGWRGIPTILNGKASTFCPVCVPNGQPRQHQATLRQRPNGSKPNGKRKAQRAARKRNRR